MKNDNREDGKEKEKTNKIKLSKYIFTRETLGMTLLLFCGVVLVTLFTGKGIFGTLGTAVCTFMYGTFGYGSILIVAVLAALGFWLVFEKMIKINKKIALSVSLSVFLFFLLFHAVSTRAYALTTYGSYISDCYVNASRGFAGYTFGGVISALIVYPFAKLTTFVGAYVLLTLLFAASIVLVVFVVRGVLKNRRSVAVTEDKAEDAPTEEEPAVVAEIQPVYDEGASAEEYPAEANRYDEASAQPAPQYGETDRKEEDDDRFSDKNIGRQILFKNGEFAAESYRRNMIFNEDSYFNNPVTSDEDYLAAFSSGKKNDVPENQTYSESYQSDVLNSPASSAPSSYVYGETPVADLSGQPSAYVYNEELLNSPADNSEPIADLSENYSDVVTPEPEEETPKETYFEPSEEFRSREAEPDGPSFISEPRSERAAGFGDTPAREENSREERYHEIINEEPASDGGNANDFFSIFGSQNPRANENRVEPDASRLTSRTNENGGETDSPRLSPRAERGERAKPLFEDTDDDVFADDDVFSARKTEPTVPPISPTRPVVPPSPAPSPLGGERGRDIRRAEPAPAPEPVKEEKPRHVWKKYVRPGLDLLDDYPENNNVNTGEIEDNKRTIVDTLLKFKIESEISNVVIGPAITRYDVIIADKTNIKRSLNYREEIAMALMKDNVNAYLNYSRGALSIEVPNNNRSVVGLKSMLASQKFINAKPNSLTFALGKNVEGEVVCPDITKMPHLLVAGTTGSGKSICLSALLVSLLYKYGPEELRLILVDPKQVEFISYDKLPHLMINEIIFDTAKAIKALNWANREMERRYTLFKDMTEKGVATKNLDEYNAHLPEGEEKLPKIVIILDEFGDLMIQAKKDIESRIIKLVQKARACGIHLVLATQRPSVDCITGLIKSNLPTRIGFKVNSFDDSRTIFDIGGAEKLLGKGDMYFRSVDRPELARIQGCFIDTHEVQRVTDFIKSNNETYFDQSVSDFINTEEEDSSAANSGGGSASDNGEDMKIDETFIKALKYCVTSNQASVSMIQRRFPVGYIKACKIIDWMESMDYVTQSEGSKPRKVLMTKEQFVNIYGEVDD